MLCGVIQTQDPALEHDVRRDLSTLAAGLDARFVDAGMLLGTAIETIDRIVGAVERITGAFDADTAGGAVDHLETAATRLTKLPAAQVVRSAELTTLGKTATMLRARVLDMHETLHVLRIYGVNIKIAAAGETSFVGFVDRMTERLDVGKQNLDTFLAKLKALGTGIAAVEQAERLLAAECARAVPHVPQKMIDDARALQRYMDTLRVMALQAADIARTVQDRVATVLGALQVGDSTRQRLEHVVTGLQMLEASSLPDPAAGWIRRLLARQLEATAEAFETETSRIVPSLVSVGEDTTRLQALIHGQDDANGRAFLVRLEQGIAEVAHVTAKVAETEMRARSMTEVVAGTVNELTSRLSVLRRIQLDVEDISTNTRLLCRRHGRIGKAVSVIAAEIDVQAALLGMTADRVALPIGNLAEMNFATDPQARGPDMGQALDQALATIRDGCLTTERAIDTGGDDARELILLLDRAAADLGNQLAMGNAIRTAAAAIAPPHVPIEPDAAGMALLGEVAAGIAALYSMAAERDIHTAMLPVSLAMAAPVQDEDEDEDEDGLF